MPVTSQTRCGVDNLEYHLMNREHDYINTPNPVSTLPIPNAAMGATANNIHGHQPNLIHLPVAGRQKLPSEEEMSDDHDYYNEYDRLQRELQPLNNRRNETTV